MSPASQEPTDELRRRAEELLRGGDRESEPGPGSRWGGDLKDLVHELEVHQCELEIQNEELRRVQHELELARDRYFDLFDLAPTAYWSLDSAGKIAEANLAAAELVGRPRRSLLGAHLSRFVARQQVEPFHRFWRAVLKSRVVQTCLLALTREGRSVPVRLLATRTGAVADLVRVVGIDLSELSEAQAALSASQERFRTIFESAGGAIVVCDPAGRITEANPAAVRLFGYPAEELKERTFLELTHPEDRAASVAGHRSFYDTPGATYEAEKRYLRPDGTVVWGHLCARGVPDATGSPAYSIALIQDITDRKQAEQALRDQRAELQGVLDTASEAIVTAAADGTIRSVNRTAEELFGYARGELIGANVRALMPSPEREAHDGYMRRYLQTGEPRLLGTGGRELTALRRDGREVPIHLSLSEVRLGGERVFCAFVRDLRQSKRLEERLRLAQRMEAVGTLASGVAHDFNNLLMGVSGCANLALDSLAEGHPARLYLEEIRRAIGSGAETVRQLIGYSRESTREHVRPTTVDLNAVVARCQTLIEPLVGDGVELSLALDPAVGQVVADEPRLEQILLNLASNARDALPEGGELRIATSVVGPAGEQAALSVADTGVGIAPEVRERIFDPFFTTKPEGEGSGLGLFSTYGIVQDWGGEIEAFSAPGSGTRFELLLRRSLAPAEAPTASTESGAGPVAGGTVLLVEDDRLVRLTTRYYLEQAGYRVLEAGRGDEAVARAREAEGLDLVLTDVTLPGQHGARVAEELRRIAPGVPVLFMSAHERAVLEREDQLSPGAALLIKPFAREALLAQVAELLGETPDEARTGPDELPSLRTRDSGR